MFTASSIDKFTVFLKGSLRKVYWFSKSYTVYVLRVLERFLCARKVHCVLERFTPFSQQVRSPFSQQVHRFLDGFSTCVLERFVGSRKVNYRILGRFTVFLKSSSGSRNVHCALERYVHRVFKWFTAGILETITDSRKGSPSELEGFLCSTKVYCHLEMYTVFQKG